MLLIILKIVAGLAVLGIISLVMLAVVSALRASIRSAKQPGGNDGRPKDN